MGLLDGKALRRHMAGVVEAQAELHKQVLDKVQASRDRQRASASRGVLPNFSVGEYVLVVARVRRSGTTSKLLITWTGPMACGHGGTATRVRCAEHRLWRS